MGVRLKSLGDLQEFHNVKSPFARFVFGNIGLRLTQQVGNLLLGHACVFACVD